jgi:hypothetical protein
MRDVFLVRADVRGGLGAQVTPALEGPQVTGALDWGGPSLTVLDGPMRHDCGTRPLRPEATWAGALPGLVGFSPPLMVRRRPQLSAAVRRRCHAVRHSAGPATDRRCVGGQLDSVGENIQAKASAVRVASDPIRQEWVMSVQPCRWALRAPCSAAWS